MYFVRRVTDSPPCVSYWTRSTPTKEFARALQLGLEYAPAPPFNSGDPKTAAPHIVAAVNARVASRLESAAAQVREAALKVSAEPIAG